MTPDQACTLMTLRGYLLQSSHPDGDMQGFAKQHEEGVPLVAYVSKDCTVMEVIYRHSHVSLSTGLIALTHPKFDIYESYVVKAAQALCLCGV